jgi:hypothetical protein
MRKSFAVMFAVLSLAGLAGCDRFKPKEEGDAAPAHLEAPAPESDTARIFTPQGAAATSATGELTLNVALQMPDASDADHGASPREAIQIRGANGLILDGDLTGASPLSTQAGGQTLRALLGLPVNASQSMVYRVRNETKPENGQGVCGADAPAYIVVWEPDGPGVADDLKILGVKGAAPGAAGAQPCALLAYTRK